MAKKYITPAIFAIEMEGEEMLETVSGNVGGDSVVGITFGGTSKQGYHSDAKDRNNVVDMGGDDEEW